MNDPFSLESEYEISRESLEKFWQDGWTSLPGLISPAVAAEIKDRLFASDGIVAPSKTEKWMTAQDYQRVLRMHDGMAWRDDWFRELALSPRLSSLALSLMDRDEGLFIHDMSFIKPGSDSAPTPFHQDFPHWPFDRKGAFTIWIALTDISENMGPLQFLPQSHREGPMGRYSEFAGHDMCKEHPELMQKYRLEGGKAMKAGDATVHVDLMVHGANSNTEEKDRAAYTVRYMPTDVRYTGAPHRHFEKFGLKSGDKFSDAELVPQIRRGA